MAADFGGELQALQNEILRLELINRRAQVEALNSAYIRILVRMRNLANGCDGAVCVRLMTTTLPSPNLLCPTCHIHRKLA